MIFNDKNLQLQEFAVNRDYGDDEAFFRLITPGGEVQLPKLLFQQGKPLPETLNCRVKGYNGSLPVISHNMPRYVSDFYADGYSKGQEFEFKVISLPEGPRGFYRLSDDNGLIFRLTDPKATLTKGQTVKCRFSALGPNYFSLRRSAADAQLPMLSLNDITRIILVHGVNTSKLDAQLQQIPELETALDELNHGRPMWVLTAIRAIKPIMPRIFMQTLERHSYETAHDVIRGYERLLLYLLQGSGFLRDIKGPERTMLQTELTYQLEQIDVYKRTLHILSNNEERKFIDNLLQNLKESGYLYHPTQQFSIMMLLFRMSPELVNTSLGNIFDTLMGWDLETWKAEPFRQAFVEQLEIYISETREDIDKFLQAETAADNEKVEKVLTAIAIQQALSTRKDTIDNNLNTSLFYRYLSLLRSAKAKTLLAKSYLALMGVKLPTDYTWSDIKEPTMMMTRAAVDPPANAVLPQDYRYYINGKGDIEIEVGPEGICIGRTDDDAGNALPNGMLSWPGLQVRVDLQRTINRSKIKTIDGHAEFWQNIEEALFVPDSITHEQVSTRRAPDIEDKVRIIVDRVIPSAHDFNRIEAFECKIVDDHFIEGRGILPADQIVNYNLHGVTVGTFRHDDGEHMMFDAEVIDIDDNDTLIFSLADQAYSAIRDMANTNEKCYCVVTKDNGRSYSAISEKGFGLYVNKENDGAPPFHRGNVLQVRITGYSNDAIQSVVEAGPIDNYSFYNARALHNLLLAIAVERDNDVNENMQIDDEDKLPVEDIKEIIDIFRYYAVASRENMLESFDYLSYARLLALTINAESIASTIKAHRDMLLLHQHYAKNKSLYPEDIDRITDAAPDSIYIRRMATRLHIVATLGHPEHNQRLWDIANNSDNEMDQELAQMVLSYNLLSELNREDPTAAAIKDRIAQKLNVNSEQRKLKYYGSESQYVEFKSSLVYPAQKGKSGISAADPDKQEYEILHIIAGFMNTYGGTLYIGVSDDHYERGLEDDFGFYRMDTSERNNKYRRYIKSLDNLANYLQNLIDSAFSIGRNAGDYARTFVDDESVKGVIGVKIAPCPHIVYLDNNLYVRHGAKTEPMTRKEEREMFIADRPLIYKQLINANTPVSTTGIISDDDDDDTRQATESATPTAQAKQVVEATSAASESQAETTTFEISTSRVRGNVLHEYNDADHFVQPYRYIRFVNDSNMMVTADEWSIDPENDKLDLVVTDEEADGYLLMVFEGEYAINVRMRELLNKKQNEPIPYYGERKLIFACPVKAGDGLYSLHSNTKNTLYERVTPVDRITQGSPNAIPERLLESEGINTEMYEMVRADRMGELAAIHSTGMKRTQIGSLVKGVASIKTSIEDAKKSILNRLK